MGIVRARNVIFYMFRCVVVCLVLLCSTPAINKFDSFGRSTQKCISMGRTRRTRGKNDRDGCCACGVERTLEDLGSEIRARRWKVPQLISAPTHVKKCGEIAADLRKCFHTRSAVGISHPLFPNFPKTRLCSSHYQLRSAFKSFLRPRLCSVI